MSESRERPQRIDVGDLAENITLAVQRALQAQGAAVPGPPWRIIIGLIFDHVVAPQIRSE